jgi:hypothetical protein
MPLGTGLDAFKCAAETTEFITGVRLPDKAELQCGQMHLGVENPEQYRARSRDTQSLQCPDSPLPGKQ